MSEAVDLAEAARQPLDIDVIDVNEGDALRRAGLEVREAHPDRYGEYGEDVDPKTIARFSGRQVVTSEAGDGVSGKEE